MPNLDSNHKTNKFKIGFYITGGVVIIAILIVSFNMLYGKLMNKQPITSQDPKRKMEVNSDGDKLYTYEDMQKDIKRLQKEHPDLIKVESIGKTKYQRDLTAVTLGKGKVHSLINASHHAREWLTTSLVMKMLEEYAHAYKTGTSIDQLSAKKILSETSICFVPMVNPDGVTLEQIGLKAFDEKAKKELLSMNKNKDNFITWKANAQGIDPNDQYPARWEDINNNVDIPASAGYKGTAAAIIPEVVAMMALTRKLNPNIVAAYHSSGEYIYWKYHSGPEDLVRDKKIAKKIQELTGYRMETEADPVTDGGYKDWFIQEFEKPGFTIEIGKFRDQMPLPVSELDEIWKQNKGVGLLIAQEAMNLK